MSSKEPHSRLSVKSGYHRKTLHVGNGAWGAFMRLVAISNDYGTDGWVDDTTVNGVCSPDELARLTSVFPWRDHNAPLLEREGEGYLIHDFFDWNDSAKQVAERKAAKSRGGRARAQQMLSTCSADAPAEAPAEAPAHTQHAGVGVGVVSDREEDPERQAGPPPEASGTRAIAEADPSPPPTPPPRASGAAGFAADAWVEGVRSVTGGRPTLAPWERLAIEELARDRPPDAEPSAWGRSEGAAFARRQRACRPPPQATAKNYLAWVGDGRQAPFDRSAPRVSGPPPDTPPAPYHAEADSRTWLHGPRPSGDEVAAGAAAALAALGGDP